jgi:predicted nuclease of predicted toxin-antitoxin system
VKFKLDENMPVELERFLAGAGHDVETVYTEQLAGSKDLTILQAATAERRVVMTFDLDFADVHGYPPGSHGGIVVFRLRDQRWQTLRQPVERLLGETDLGLLEAGLAIVEESRVRYSRRR